MRSHSVQLPFPLLLFLGFWVGFSPSAGARVVINEILYHPPAGLEELQFIELYNSGEEEANVGGWAFTRGIQFKFPADTLIPANGFLVLCRNPARFKEQYDTAVAGSFSSHLSRNGERLELTDARGRVVDGVKYQDEPPWPVAADGSGSSLERICPDAGGDNPANWAGAIPGSAPSRVFGTPGRTNSCYSPQLPPAVTQWKVVPSIPQPGQAIQLEVSVRAPDGVESAEVFYRVTGPGFERAPQRIPLVETGPGRYRAEIPGQAVGTGVRFQFSLVATGGARRVAPSGTEPVAAFSVFVPGRSAGTPGSLPVISLWQTTTAETNLASPRLAAAAVTNRGTFLFQDPATGRSQLFDFVSVEARKGGFKVHFAKGHPFEGMTSLQLVTEQDEKLMVTEPLAYEFYRKAGVPAPRCEPVQVELNGVAQGCHLLLEPVNHAFLRRNKLKDSGSLYAVHGSQRGRQGLMVADPPGPDADRELQRFFGELEKSRGPGQWEEIKTHVDVPEVATYLAVNTLLSHWDGYFQHYVAHRGGGKNGRWALYPWNQAQSWGASALLSPGESFHTLPVGFKAGTDPAGWWHPGGHFAGPLLANAEFRQACLARTRQLLETQFTEAALLPLLEKLGGQVHTGRLPSPPAAPAAAGTAAAATAAAPTAPASARSGNGGPGPVADIRDYIVRRREFLLGQEEIRGAGDFVPAQLVPPPPPEKKSKSKSTAESATRK